MALYSAKQFSGCVFNPLVNGSLMQAEPDLAQVLEAEWKEDPNIDIALRYVICVYDPKSPLVARERDLNRRKAAAAELLGATDDITEQLTECSYPKIAEGGGWIGSLILLYLKEFVKSREWATICALEFSFWENIELLMQPIKKDNKDKEVLESVQKKSAIKGGMETDISLLESYYKKFFGDDVAEETVKKARLTPQGIARAAKL